MDVIAEGRGFKIGYNLEGIAVQTDVTGDWVEAHEACPFTDSDWQEYRCYDGKWEKTDETGNVQ